MALSARPKLREESTSDAGADEAKSEDRLMTDVAETFIEILKNARKTLAEGIGQNLPEGQDTDSRNELTERVGQLREDVVAPLQALCDDLSSMVLELETECSNMESNLEDADIASSEADDAMNEREEFDGDEESDEFAELEDEATRTENAQGEADEAVDNTRDMMIAAIDTLVTHIGEVKSAGEGE